MASRENLESPVALRMASSRACVSGSTPTPTVGISSLRDDELSDSKNFDGMLIGMVSAELASPCKTTNNRALVSDYYK